MAMFVVTASRVLGDKQNREWAYEWIYSGFKRLQREYPQERRHLLIHGGARGGDRMAEEVARYMNWMIWVEKAEWGKYGQYAGFKRNEVMVSYNVDAVIGFPWGEARGTRHCLDHARKLGRRTLEMSRVRRYLCA